MLPLFIALISSISVSEREDIIDAVLDQFELSPFTKRFSRNAEFISHLRKAVYDDSDSVVALIDENSTSIERHRSQRIITQILIQFIIQNYRPAIKQTPSNFAIPS